MNKKDLPAASGFRKMLIVLCDKIAAVCHVIAALAIFVMLSLVVIQVVFRYVFNTPIGWTQELSVFSLMLAVMAGAAVAFWRGEHFKVSVIVDSLPPVLGKLIILTTRLITVTFLCVVVWFSYALAMRAMMQVSPTTGIPIGYIQLFLTSGSCIAAFLLIVKTLLGHEAISDDNIITADKIS